MTLEVERINRGLVMSFILHGALFAFVILSPNLFPNRGDSWGSATGGSGGIDVKIVSTVAGLALPSPEVVTKDVPANDSPGFYRSEEAPPPPPPDKAELIPDTNVTNKKTPPKPAPTPAPKSAPAPEPPPENAVAFGKGGKPDLAYGQFPTGAGSAGVGFDDSIFGARYGYYVDAMTRRISQNWLKSLVDSRVQRAPRVYLTFDIARDGTINNIEIKQPSGIPSLDRSAERAIRASDPLQPLPGDYRGSSVRVSFYFEYSR